MLDAIHSALDEAADVLAALRSDADALAAIDRAAKVLVDSFKSGGRVVSCGNGGSMCDAMHFAEELSGRFREDRPALAAIAISDPGHLSCVANDYGYERVFARFVEAHGRKGDVLLGISTSGSSANVLEACRQAAALGMKTIVLTGKRESDLAKLADVAIVTPGGAYADRVQELHIKVIHILIECVERSLFETDRKA